MKAVQIGSSVLLSLFLFILPFSLYVQIVSIQPAVYEQLVRKSGLFYPESEIQEAGKILYQGLMQGKTIIFSSKQAELTEQEQKHMLDVSRLLLINRFCCVISLLVLLLILFLCYQRKQWKWLNQAGIGSLLLFAVILFTGLLSFDGLFFLFHRLCFRNDLWLLPSDSVLLKLFPARFFFRHFIGIISVALGWHMLLVCITRQLMKGSAT